MPHIKRTTERPWIKKPEPFHGINREGFDYNCRAWRKLSHAKRRSSPLCEECERNGIIKEAVCVDHIEPISKGGDAWKWDNLQSLCRKCHDSKTGRSK